MNVLTSVAGWFANPANWQGPDGVPTRLLEHLQICVPAVVLAMVVAIPAGLFIGHTGRGAALVVNSANIGRAVPSYAVLVMIFPLALQARLDDALRVPFGFVPTFAAMTLLAIPPVVTNTYVGVSEVDRDLRETARGMGMRELQVLRQVEIPLALPVILAGLRTAAVQVVATATLGALIGLGGLGRYIVDGLARRENDLLFAGALLVALLAIATELAFAIIQRGAVSRGLAPARTRPFTEPSQIPMPVEPGLVS